MVRIRSVHVQDAESLAALLRRLEDLSQIGAETAAETLRRVRAHLAIITESDRHTLLVAEDGTGTTIGYASAHWQPTMLRAGGEGYISELFIHPEKRGAGIGTQLLEHIKHEARERGCTRLQLENMRHKPSYQRGYYTKRGWQERALAANFVYDLTSSGVKGDKE